MKNEKIERLASAVMDEKGKYNLNLDKVTKGDGYDKHSRYIVQIGNVKKQYVYLKNAVRDFKCIFSMFDTKLKPKMDRFSLLNAIMESLEKCKLVDHGYDKEYDSLYDELWENLSANVRIFDPKEEKLSSYVKYYFA